MATLKVEIDEEKIRRIVTDAFKKLANEVAGYPIVTEHDGSRWISLDWLLEKLKVK